jgi:hypothetical protein
MASDFEAAMALYAGLPQEAMERRVTFRGMEGPMQGRDLLYQSLEEEQRAFVEGAATELTEPARILSLAQGAFGELRGLLSGLDRYADESPGNRDWSLRQTLEHAYLVEVRYHANTDYAVHRSETEPLRLPDDRQPQSVDGSGTLTEILARMCIARTDSDAGLAGIAPQAMTRPTIWAGYEVDVRFRLHRFASHIVEHTNQCEKALRALAVDISESRAIARRIWGMRGLHERITSRARLQELDALHLESALSLTGPQAG